MILDREGRGEVWKKAPEAPIDRLTHIYTLVLYNDSQYVVYVDRQLVENGTISEDWDVDYDQTVHKYIVGGVGIDVWQVKAGTLFDNILITESLDDAMQYAKKFMDSQTEGEKKQKDNAEEEEKRLAELQQQKLRAELEHNEQRVEEDL